MSLSTTRIHAKSRLRALNTLRSDYYVCLASCRQHCPYLEGESVLCHDEGEHGEAEDLGGVGLGRGHADLGPRVDVHAAVRLARDGRT